MPKRLISVKYEGFDVYRKMLKGAPSRFIDATDGIFKHDTNKSKNLSRTFAPVKTGKLRSAIKSKRKKEMHYEIYIDGRISPYGAAQELGSKPHIIEPVRAKVLRFEVGGQTVYSKRVKHPGTKGIFFVKRGVAAGFKGVENRLINAYTTILKRMGGK